MMETRPSEATRTSSFIGRGSRPSLFDHRESLGDHGFSLGQINEEEEGSPTVEEFTPNRNSSNGSDDLFQMNKLSISSSNEAFGVDLTHRVQTEEDDEGNGDTGDDFAHNVPQKSYENEIVLAKKGS